MSASHPTNYSSLNNVIVRVSVSGLSHVYGVGCLYFFLLEGSKGFMQNKKQHENRNDQLK